MCGYGVSVRRSTVYSWGKPLKPRPKPIRTIDDLVDALMDATERPERQVTRNDIQCVVDCLFDCGAGWGIIAKGLEDDGIVDIQGFGILTVHGRDTIKFRPHKPLQERLGLKFESVSAQRYNKEKRHWRKPR